MLEDLPFELLSHIYTHLPTSQSVFYLSLTCRALHSFTAKEGWKIFLRMRFPSLPIPTAEAHDLRDAVHGLTTLSRNWDRKAFLARYLEPYGCITSLATLRRIPQWNSPQGQTMGYQPSIDSYEEWTGSNWSARKQVLAWSAGTELILRVKSMGPEVARLWEGADAADQSFYFNEYKHMTAWFTWKMSGRVEGRDDITTLNVIRPFQKDSKQDSEDIVFGTASGELLRLNVGMTDEQRLIAQNYAVNGRSVRSTAISSSSSPLLAACLSDSLLALYPVYDALSDTGSIAPLSEFTAIPEGKKDCRVWSTQFLSDDRLAIGLGPSTEPVHVYEVTPGGITKNPIRKFGLDGRHWAPGDRNSSVYPIAPLPSSSQGGHTVGQVFLSGCYDGIIRLHDMRSPSAYESSYWDPTNDSAIYSLQTQGRERLIAGASRHSMLKVFDLRVAGGRAYHYLDVPVTAATKPNQSHRPNPHQPSQSHSAKASTHYGWNLFLNPRNYVPRQHQRSSHRSAESPIYSLSLPSAASPTLFAGVENNVVQFDFVSMLDAHPDPLFNPVLERSYRTGRIDVKSSWNPRHDILQLAMYEQSPENGGAVQLLRQAGVGRYRGEMGRELDERWRDPGGLRHRRW
ncbi:hypothetical protein AOQ84DRAFT_332091 [Glonium stellatum]|uniref:F-box domain-containing protein n=1 Tax=Glonium stellatum TaxID=574774 RepID=A0A8E2FBX8_9PEZI|nr:hypothetical protein AOQ84DRAFT_332091 [Glonium stellatum]